MCYDLVRYIFFYKKTFGVVVCRLTFESIDVSAALPLRERVCVNTTSEAWIRCYLI